MSAPILQAQRLSVRYGKQPGGAPVFVALSFELAQGEVVSLLGPSGIGKSSLLRALAGVLPPFEGELRVGAERLRGPSHRVALAFQDARLLPWLDVEQNVALGLRFARSAKLSRAEQRARVHEALERVGLSHARKLAPSQLSGGMAQRVSFARCLARRPDVLLLDEPFGALDEVTRADMQALVTRVARELGTAVLLSTHDIDEALALSQRVCLLGGRPARLLDSWQPTAEPEQLRPQIVRALAAARDALRESPLASAPTPEGTVSCATT